MSLIDVDNVTVSGAVVALDIVPDGASEELTVETGGTGLVPAYNPVLEQLTRSAVLPRARVLHSQR